LAILEKNLPIENLSDSIDEETLLPRVSEALEILYQSKQQFTAQLQSLTEEKQQVESERQILVSFSSLFSVYRNL